MLEYVIAIHEQGSFINASKLLGVSQPTLSMQMKRCADELGVVLFVCDKATHGRPVITIQGLFVYTQAKIIVNAMEVLYNSNNKSHL